VPHDPDIRLIEEVAGEVRELEVGLVARGAQYESDALLLSLEDGRP
jgi:hypothetical protein